MAKSDPALVKDRLFNKLLFLKNIIDAQERKGLSLWEEKEMVEKARAHFKKREYAAAAKLARNVEALLEDKVVSEN